MGRSLLNKIGSGIKTGLKVAGATLGAAVLATAVGCKPPSNFFNFPPKTIFSAYGDKSDIIIKDDGTDLNGKSDIVSYSAKLTDSNGNLVKRIVQSTPIDTQVPVKDGTYFAYGDVTDKAGADDPKGPIKIVISSNSPPTAFLTATAGKGNIIIEGKGTDPDGNLFSLEYWALLNNEGKKIFDVTKDVSSVNASVPVPNGTYYVYLKATDDDGATNTAGPAKVIVSYNPPPPKPTPVPSLGFTKTSGDSPFETTLNAGGSETGGTISQYDIGIDFNNDGVIEPDEVILSSTAPIPGKKLVFIDTTGVGTEYEVGEVVYDSVNGTSAQSPLEEILANPAQSNSDISASANFNGPYMVGSKVTFSSIATNSTSPHSDLTVDNSNRQSIGYKFLHELGSFNSGNTGVFEELVDLYIPDDLVVTLKNGGYMKMTQLINPDTLEFEIANADVTYNGITLSIGSQPFSYSQAHKAEVIEKGKTGKNKFELELQYKKGGSSEPLDFKYLSQDFTSTN